MVATVWTESGTSIDVEALRPGPGVPWALHLERVNLEKNQARLYLLPWASALFGRGLVRTYGRIGCWQRAMPPLVFDLSENALISLPRRGTLSNAMHFHSLWCPRGHGISMEEDWPRMRAIVRQRLRHGYQVAG